MPTDLEQVSPDSDKKSLPDAMDMDESRGEEVEEEIVDDEDFESPAFEPIEAIVAEKNDNSNLSAISGLTSQDSLENKSDPGASEPQQETQLSQISSIQDMSQETSEAPVTSVIAEDVAMTETPVEPQKGVHEEPEKSNFDLKKDSIEFTGTGRKSISLEDSPSNVDPQKVLLPQDVPSNTMEIDNLYENDTTDSCETRMEIDLKDETTQGTTESTKVEESSQDSTVSKEKSHSEAKKDSHHHHNKSDHSRDDHKSSSSYKSKHHHRSSSSKSHHDDKHRKSSSSSHKKSSSEKDRSTSSRRDHDKDKKTSRDDASRSKHREHKSDDHQQEKSRRKSTDHDTNEIKGDKLNLSEPASTSADTKSDREKKIESTGTTTAETLQQQVQETTENKPVKHDKMLSEHCEISLDSRSSTSSTTKKEQKSSILIKYDYLKSAQKTAKVDQIDDGFFGFAFEKLPENPWFECLRKETLKHPMKKPVPKSKSKPKVKQTIDSPSDSTEDAKLPMETEETLPESRAQSIAQQQRYDTNDLYKPRFDFGYRNRRRGQGTEEAPDEAQGSKPEAASPLLQASKPQ